MKIVNTGNIYRVYDDSLKTYDELPAGTYTVCFDKMTGFFMERKNDIKITEKIYGCHLSKVTKIMNTFSLMDRNLGVILSGEKGIGKSITAKLLAQNAVENNLPVICVDFYLPGIASYISSIEQKCVVLFDEFDKTFKSSKDSDKTTAQDEMLSLFDGIDQGKKLFVVTCNSLYSLSDYLINRPGRFHYHLRFDFPNADEIREYLNDKLSPEYKNQIEEVVQFSNVTDLNYDCLRSIAFEMNLGIPFKEAIKDLNITSYNNEYEYDVTCWLDNGMTCTKKKRRISLNDVDEYMSFSFPGLNNSVHICFDPSSHVFDYQEGVEVIKEQAISSVRWDRGRSGNVVQDDCSEPMPVEVEKSDDECDSDEEKSNNKNDFVNPKIIKITLRRKSNYHDIHYMF